MFMFIKSLITFLFLNLLISSSYAELAAGHSSVKFSVLVTAESSGSLEAIVVEDGSWLTKRKLVQTAVMVKHDQGEFLFDSGIGRQYAEQMSVFSLFEKQLFKIENVDPARDQLERQHYDSTDLMAIIPSHMHWDHASGLEDFKGVPVWVQKNSYEEAMSGKPPGFVISQYDDPALAWHDLSLTDGPYENFEHSLDLFNDGRVVLVDLSGHTAGQLGMFINLDSGKRYFFIGDTSWAALGIKKNKPRPAFVNWLVTVDSNYEKNSQVVQQVHDFSVANPEVLIVPAHDELVIAQLPRYPIFSE